MPDSLADADRGPAGSRHGKETGAARTATASLRELTEILWRRRKLAIAIEAGLLLLCLLYCLVAPNQYESTAWVELRTAPASALNFDAQEALVSTSILSAPLALETLAGVLRSDQLAWQVITELKLYQSPVFLGHSAGRFSGFDPAKSTPEAQAWLLDRFTRRLRVESKPRTLLIEVRFRSHDAALSAAVVNTLIRVYQEQEMQAHMQATAQASAWLNGQLAGLKARVDEDQRLLAGFESLHGIVSTPEIQPGGQQGETQHSAILLEIDDLGRQQVVATSDRILSEAEYRAAAQGDPETVIAADPRLQAESGNFATALVQQIRAQRSALEQERAQLSAEHGPNFPRVVEIGKQLDDLDRQKKAEDTKLVERFRNRWQTALDREQLVRKSLEQATGEGMKLSAATTEYAVMRQEANASHDLYVRVMEKAEEAGFAAGVHSSNISVVDPARQPAKPVAPNLPLDLAITFFVGVWIAGGAVLLREALSRPVARVAAMLLLAMIAAGATRAQAPTPSTSGLPAGVANLPPSQPTYVTPNPKEAPMVWNQAGAANVAGATAQSAAPMPAPIGPGDSLDVSEYHTPEFHSAVRVSPEGTVTLPMIGEIKVQGLDEHAAARAIEAALVAKGMLLHPAVSVLVTAYVGQEVSVLGEVARPGVYPYAYHHRLLDLISAAGGLTPGAGRLVNVFHAPDPKTPHPVVLDPTSADATGEHNPELNPGDTVQVSRAGLVYVVGDVIRPGGFPVDPVQGLTVVQALTLAWGPSQNAATRKAVLIREQHGGRAMIALDLRRMLRGQDPDQPVEDRDILYVPDSMAKNLANRMLESAIQSAIGVTIYSALVYSQRY